MTFQINKKFGILMFILVVSAGIFAGGGILHAQYNVCNYHAYKDCVGSSIYWFDSCSNRQDLYQDCSSFGQTCQYGQCVASIQPVYTAHQKISCSGNNLYWYDSLGAVNSLYKNCQDANSCTQDSCSGAKCSNVLKCDGSTCAAGLADYNTYCQQAQPNPPPNDVNNLMVSFVAKTDEASQQWNKNAQVSPDSTVYFMIALNNNSDTAYSNVNISANIPGEISLLGNLKVNDAAFSGDIVSGISIGSLEPKSAKSITFEGKTQSFSEQSQKQATITVNSSGAVRSDFVNLDFVPGQSTVAAVSQPAEDTGITTFLKRWYLWILSGIVLIFLFIIVFRRVSSNV
ncbi:MAG: hypothetical protein A2510_02255 [Candidatus Staskawiczbacteria bacterium RIFOXYD12_FULL_37_10]|nr:MAG: hypothetical protein A2325_03805 [Candidatus Staskawiczbacteria bacterium RIFOXYB2_FULL_37_10]OGZ91638.1 MAG: hypothetical protein A2510_02255 [Candidatus Staskawiczbacteria bacterium RIFOXYD12_FULL_37_10]